MEEKVILYRIRIIRVWIAGGLEENGAKNWVTRKQLSNAGLDLLPLRHEGQNLDGI
jgi:hypothetical protein